MEPLDNFCSKEFTECIELPNVKYVICQIGGNDLDMKFRSKTNVFTSILLYADFFNHGLDNENVTVNQMLLPGKTRHIPVYEFNRKTLKQLQAVKHLLLLIYWKHKARKMAMSTYFTMTRCISTSLE